MFRLALYAVICTKFSLLHDRVCSHVSLPESGGGARLGILDVCMHVHA